MCQMEVDAIAMVFTDQEPPFEERKMPKPEPESGEVLVNISYCTICTSDLHTYYGRRKSPAPSILGHEIIGIIEKLPQNGLRDFNGIELKIGDLVTWTVYAHDHEGKMAKKGLPQKSDDLFKYGHEKLNGEQRLSGGYATHCLLRKGTDIFLLPDNINSRLAAPINCTHATMAGAMRLAGDLKGKNVLITGLGMLGLSGCAMAKEAGANQVVAYEKVPNRLHKALEFGASELWGSFESLEILKDKCETLGGIDVVIDTTGIPDAMQFGLDILAIGGTAVWVGAVYKQPPLTIEAEDIVRRLLTIRGLHNYKPKDLETAVAFIKQFGSKYRFKNLVEKEYHLSEVDQAFKEAINGYYRVGVNMKTLKNE